MKQMTRVKLINWHRFENETINFGPSVLLSGENGAGKSTILDAIQFVITCSKNHFNKAAHEKGKRNLNGYIRCKTGKEDKPYEREGSLSAHIALEFYEDKKDQYFIVGVVMDSVSEDREPGCAWYLMDKTRLDDSMFFHGQVPKSISVFRGTNKKIKQFITTQAEAKKMILSRFGRLEDKFFSLIPKALAFKPIHDIKDFVYSYVLDEKAVNIDALKDNVRSYQDLERMLQSVRARMQKLEKIQDYFNTVDGCLKKDRIYDYYLARVAREITEQTIENSRNRIVWLEGKQKENDENKREKNRLYEQKHELLVNLTVELEGNEEYRAISALEQETKQLDEVLAREYAERTDLRRSMNRALKDAKRLLEVKDVDHCILDYAHLLENPTEIDSTADAVRCIDEVIRYKKKMFEKVQEKRAQLTVSANGKKQELSEVRGRIRELEKKKLTYAPSVTRLLEKIQQQFDALGRKGRPRVLCELLEITNPAWSNAVEGYLNSQRFYILVEPEDFDLALSVYDKARENQQVYGVGLINTAKLDRYDTVPEGSLATVVTSKSVWAKRYINMILGKVHMCKSFQELKKYDVAITRQCMRYQNHVVSAIRPEIYETPFIGAEAYKIQLEKCRRSEAGLTQEVTALDEHIHSLEYVAEPLESQWDVDVKYKLPVLESIRHNKARRDACRHQIEEIKKNSTLIQKQLYLDEVRKESSAVLAQIQQLDRDFGRISEEIRKTRESMDRLYVTADEQSGILAQAAAALKEELSASEREYAKQMEGKSPDKFAENFERTREGQPDH